MIIQTVPESSPHFVIEQNDHTPTCGQLARAFGNENFHIPAPRALLIYIVEHHDAGWIPVDALAEQSPVTGLPHHLTQTPLPYLLKTSQGSPDFNEAHHAFCGLISSMHTYGLFNGRYGLSDFVFIEKMADDHKAAARTMLKHELARQTRLKQHLQADPATAAWVSDDYLFTHYKLLQFFDTLALYFQMTHAEVRQATQFLNVPDGWGNDHTLKITPQPDGTYHLFPWPFATSVLEVQTAGRYLSSAPTGTDFKEIFARTPKEFQTYRIVKETVR